MTRGYRFAAALVVAMLARDAAAWNDSGHMTIAELVWRSLPSGERAAVTSLLRHHPHYDELLAANVPDGVGTNEWVFLKAATWPDMVRPAQEGQPSKPASITRYHHGDWHYVNQVYVAPGDRAAVADPGDRAGKTNVIERLGAMERLLRATQAPESERAVALCWVLHLTGDIHNPMHCATRYSPAFPKGDRGGNEEVVRTEGRVLKLHAYWDELPFGGTNHAAIARNADTIAADQALAREKLHEAATNVSYASWAAESFAAAAKVAHLDGHLPVAPFRPDIAPSDVPALSRRYEGRAHAVAARRLALAALRLEGLLKSCLGDR